MTRFRRGLAGLAAIAVLALALATAPAALAQSSSVDTYGGQGGNTISQVSDRGSGGSGDPSATGALPFTGFDLALAAGGGLLLLGAGIALSRAAHSRPAAERRGG